MNPAVALLYISGLTILGAVSGCVVYGFGSLILRRFRLWRDGYKVVRKRDWPTLRGLLVLSEDVRAEALAYTKIPRDPTDGSKYRRIVQRWNELEAERDAALSACEGWREEFALAAEENQKLKDDLKALDEKSEAMWADCLKTGDSEHRGDVLFWDGSSLWADSGTDSNRTSHIFTGFNYQN